MENSHNNIICNATFVYIHGRFSKWEDTSQETSKGKYFIGRDIFDDKICMLYIEEIDLNILQKDVIIDNNITEPRCESEDYQSQSHYKDWHWLENPVPMKGFQGIRYVDSPRVYHGKIIY